MRGLRSALGAVAALLIAAADVIYPSLQEPKHRVVFHNDSIDVYDVSMAPGERSFYHLHERDQLGVVLGGGRSINQRYGEPEVETVSVRGAISFIPHSVTGGYIHRVRAGEGPFRVIGIEFARGGGKGSVTASAAPGVPSLHFPQGRLDRLSITAGTERLVGADLIVTMSDGKLVGPGSEPWSFSEGAVRWIGDGPPASFRNASGSDVSLVVLTLAKRADY